MSCDNFRVFICLGCLFTVEASTSRWVSLSAFDGQNDTASKTTSSEFNNEGNRGGSTVPSTRMSVITTDYPSLMNTTITSSTTLYPDTIYEHTKMHFSAPEIFDDEITKIYVRLPGSNSYRESSDTAQIINRTSFNEDITWKLVRNNETNIQVTAHSTMKNSLPESSRFQVNFNPQMNDEYAASACTLSNFTCGPMVEIVTQQLPVETITHEKPIILEIKFNKTEYRIFGREWRCVYWNENGRTWKRDGLETVNSHDSTFIVCLSTHLTLFSVMLDPHVKYFPAVEIVSEDHETKLTTFSVAGSILTVLCLLVTISSYLCKRPSDSETTKILLHNCIALLLIHVSFHAYHWLGDRIDCRIINFSTHYSVMAFLLWAASDGVNMWRMLFNDVFNTRGRSFYKSCVIVSWGFPLLTTTVGVLVTDYSTNDECQLGFHQVYEFALHILPCFIILGCNLLFFVWMVAKVAGKNSLTQLRNKKIRYVAALAQVFNVVWCLTFPLLWFSKTRLLGQYLIALLVSAQGILIVIVRFSNDSGLKQRLSKSFCSRWTNSQSLSIFGIAGFRNDSVSKSSDL